MFVSLIFFPVFPNHPPEVDDFHIDQVSLNTRWQVEMPLDRPMLEGVVGLYCWDVG